MCCVARRPDLFSNRALWTLYMRHRVQHPWARVYKLTSHSLQWAMWNVWLRYVHVSICSWSWSWCFFCLVCKWSCYLLTRGQMMCRSTCQSAVELPWRSHQVILLATHGFSAMEVLPRAGQMVRSYFLFVYLFILFNKERKLESEGDAITLRWSQDEA